MNINRIKSGFLWAAIVAALLLSFACKKGPSSAQETVGIKEGVTTYLRDTKGISMEKIDLEIKDLVFKGDTATCTASLTLKGEVPTTMAFNYELEKKAGKWTVKGSKPGGDNPHAGMGMESGGMPGGMPPGHPPTGEANAPVGNPHGGMGDPHAMSGHPPVGEANAAPQPPAPPKAQ
jgi:hypothetical protein